MGAQSRRMTSLASGSGKATAVVVCAIMLLAGCGGSGGSATNASTPVIRGDGAATSSLTVSGTPATAAVGTPIALTSAGGTGAGTVTYVTTSAGCVVTGASLTATAAGTCAVTATQGAQTGTATFTFAIPLTSSLTVTVPGTPPAPSVVAGDSKVGATVAAGATGGTPTSYTVTAYAASGTVVGTCSVTGASGSCDVTPLTGGNTYTARVTATNAAGTSAASAASAEVTVVTASSSVLVDKPGIPDSPRVVAGDEKVKVTVAPWQSGGTPTSYTVRVTLSKPGSWGKGGTCTVVGARGSCDVTGLTNGVSYMAYATATNAAGTSAASKYSEWFTPGAGPGAPATPVVSTVVEGVGKVSVSVVPGTGGGTPTSYRVEAYRVTQRLAGTCTVTGASGSCEVTGLDNGTKYEIRATATNEFGSSGTSGPATPVAPSVVTFNPNRGTGTMERQAAFTATALTANAFTRPGYIFDGWATSPNGSKEYPDGGSYPFTASATLYARWGCRPLNVTAWAVRVGASTAAVQFSAQSSESPWTSFAANTAKEGGKGATVTTSANSGTITINALNSSSGYTFDVTATNAAGCVYTTQANRVLKWS